MTSLIGREVFRAFFQEADERLFRMPASNRLADLATLVGDEPANAVVEPSGQGLRVGPSPFGEELAGERTLGAREEAERFQERPAPVVKCNRMDCADDHCGRLGGNGVRELSEEGDRNGAPDRSVLGGAPSFAAGMAALPTDRSRCIGRAETGIDRALERNIAVQPVPAG